MPDYGINPETFFDHLVTMVQTKGSVRLSDFIMKAWTGKHEPPEEIRLAMSDRGIEVEAGLDHHAGWEFRLSDGNGRERLF
jgi:hypothetical protein